MTDRDIKLFPNLRTYINNLRSTEKTLQKISSHYSTNGSAIGVDIDSMLNRTIQTRNILATLRKQKIAEGYIDEQIPPLEDKDDEELMKSLDPDILDDRVVNDIDIFNSYICLDTLGEDIIDTLNNCQDLSSINCFASMLVSRLDIINIKTDIESYIEAGPYKIVRDADDAALYQICRKDNVSEM